jgi:hypothetical protein
MTDQETGENAGSNDTGTWVLGGIMGVVSLFGLFIASRAADAVFYGTGLALFVFGVLFIFFLIRKSVG